MKKIGIITFFRNYNYGSILQCFALQSVLEELGFEVKELYQRETGLYWAFRSLYIKICFVLSCVIYNKRYYKYRKFLSESHRSCDDLSDKVKTSFDEFISEKLHQETVSFSRMRNDASYDFFVCGSDQVWSLSAPMLNPFLFLRFAPRSKRVSYAASTGTNLVPPWYKWKLRRYIDGFKYVSVREPAIILPLKNIGCGDIQSHIDPTFLKTPDFWISNSSKCSLIKAQKYAVLFFLNEPSSIAVDHISRIINEKDLTIYAFPYRFKSYANISTQVEQIEVMPQEFVSVINGASMIFTDSFHGVAFSINLGKEFYVYNREYAAGTSQSTRVECILEKFNLTTRLVVESSQNSDSIVDCSEMIEKERQRSLQYLINVLS